MAPSVPTMVIPYVRQRQQQPTSVEKQKLMQQQLVLLFHAKKCQDRQNMNTDGQPCTLPHCRTMCDVVDHILACPEDTHVCTYPHCGSSRLLLEHWHRCTRATCPVCQPLREGIQRNRVNVPAPPVDNVVNNITSS